MAFSAAILLIGFYAAGRLGAALQGPASVISVVWPALLAALAAALILVLQRKAGPEVVSAREAQFRALFDSNVVPVLYWHTDGRVLEANDAYLDLCGQTRADLEARRVRWDRIGPDDPNAVELGRRDIARLRAGIRHGVPFEKMYRQIGRAHV